MWSSFKSQLQKASQLPWGWGTEVLGLALPANSTHSHEIHSLPFRGFLLLPTSTLILSQIHLQLDCYKLSMSVSLIFLMSFLFLIYILVWIVENTKILRWDNNHPRTPTISPKYTPNSLRAKNMYLSLKDWPLGNGSRDTLHPNFDVLIQCLNMKFCLIWNSLYRPVRPGTCRDPPVSLSAKI